MKTDTRGAAGAREWDEIDVQIGRGACKGARGLRGLMLSRKVGIMKIEEGDEYKNLYKPKGAQHMKLIEPRLPICSWGSVHGTSTHPY